MTNTAINFPSQGSAAMQPEYQPQQSPGQVVQFPQQSQPTQPPYSHQESYPSTESINRANNPDSWKDNLINNLLSRLSTPLGFPQQGQQSRTLPGTHNPNSPYSVVNQVTEARQQAYPQTSQYQQENPVVSGSSYSQHSQKLLQNVNPSQKTDNFPGRRNYSNSSTEELIQQFGPRAAEILNEYACQLEDKMEALTQAYQESMAYNVRSFETIQALAPHIQRYQAMENLMTDPDSLAAYTVDFFTYVQPLPERPNAAPLVRPDFPAVLSNPQPGVPDLSQIHPSERWKVADAMERQGMWEGKVLIQV
jgi:hypothetical protein